MSKLLRAPVCFIVCMTAFTAARGQDGECTVPLRLTAEERDLLEDILSDTVAATNGFEGGPFHGIAAPLQANNGPRGGRDNRRWRICELV